MESANFEESNAVLQPPHGMGADEVEPLYIHRHMWGDGSAMCVACFKVTAEELAEIQRTGRVWLTVLGVTMPPVSLNGISPFQKKE